MKVLSLFLLVLVAVLAASGNLCFKLAAKRKAGPIWKCFFSIPFMAGAGFFFICPVLSMFCARYIDFSVMYAMTALNFVFILGFSRCFLHEKMDLCKLAGVALIVLGVVLMVWSELLF